MRDWCIVPRDKFNAKYRGCGFRLIGILVSHPDYSDAELLAKEHWWHSTEVTGGTEDFIFTANNTCYSLVGQTTGIRPVMHGNIRKFCQSELDVLKKYIHSVDVPLIIRRGLQMIMKNPLQEESVPIATTTISQLSEKLGLRSLPATGVKPPNNPIPLLNEGQNNTRPGSSVTKTIHKESKEVVIRSNTGHRICSHQIRQSMCRKCNGNSICTHGKQRNWCAECGGSARCEHGRQKSKCKECGGSGFCPHGKFRYRCPNCQR